MTVIMTRNWSKRLELCRTQTLSRNSKLGLFAGVWKTEQHLAINNQTHKDKRIGREVSIRGISYE